MHDGKLQLPLAGRRCEARGSWWRRLLRRQRVRQVVTPVLRVDRKRRRCRRPRGAEPGVIAAAEPTAAARLHPSDRAAERLIRERVVEAVSRSLGDGRLARPGRSGRGARPRHHRRRSRRPRAPRGDHQLAAAARRRGRSAATVRFRLRPGHPAAADGRPARRGDHRQRSAARLRHSRRAQRTGARRLLRK